LEVHRPCVARLREVKRNEGAVEGKTEGEERRDKTGGEGIRV